MIVSHIFTALYASATSTLLSTSIIFGTIGTDIYIPVTTTNIATTSKPLMSPWNFRYDTASDIPKASFKNEKPIYGRVVKVIDGDTLRMRHLPFFPIQRSGDYSGLLSENTISVRVYGVDTPELGKFGKESMFKAEEARDYTKNKIDGKIVKVKLLKKDQYGRVIGRVTVKPIPILPKQDLSIGLAKNGYATLYTGGGAQYDGRKSLLEDAIKKSQTKRKGMWANGVEGVIDPADYKKSLRETKGKR
mmetsp:Transcript_20896/g.25621  ORF Transcript_20896/g.25621 Transcript_20896/m.25621 type:complete len:247 (-) Transcript_20896:495-1235(-)